MGPFDAIMAPHLGTLLTQVVQDITIKWSAFQPHTPKTVLVKHVAVPFLAGPGGGDTQQQTVVRVLGVRGWCCVVCV